MKPLARLSFALLLLSTLLHAGNGPHNWLVVYDPADPDGVAIARHYQQARHIPDRNLVAYSFPNNTGFAISNKITTEQGWDFVQHLRGVMAERGLEGQIHGVTLVGQVPNAVKGSRSTYSINSALAASLTALGQDDWEPRTAAYNAAFQGPDNVLNQIYNDEFRETTEIRSDIEFFLTGDPTAGPLYWLSTHLAYTGLNGLRRDEVFALIDRSVAADGTAPKGTIYWPLNINIRSQLREPQAVKTIQEWDTLGIDYQVFGQSFGGGGFTLPENKTGAPFSLPIENRAVQGAIVGGFTFDVEGANNLYLPGSIAEHVTSFGGQIGNSLKLGQTVATEWLRFGASGSSGTVIEPYAVAYKFPVARMHSHYFNGATLAEAF